MGNDFIHYHIEMNINLAFFKFALLLLSGDIESNPGPAPVSNKIQKAVLGSFHQGHPKFGDTSGIQCSCNALYIVCFSIIKKNSIWKCFDLDYILENGDKTFKTLGMYRALFLNELPHNLPIENHNIEIEKLGHYFGLLGSGNIFENHATTHDTGNGVIFMTCDFTISLIWSKNFVFLFDSRESR